MRVELLSHTPEPLAVIFAAFRQCYHAGFIGDMWPGLVAGEIPLEEQAEFVARVMASGHVSPVEHVSFTFAVSGVSRALTHQLVRHRMASYSQQSQRYVDGSGFEHVVPPAVAANAAARARFDGCMAELRNAYKDIKAFLEADGRAGNAANEDARFVLPQAAATRVVFTMNCRSLLHFFEHRCCTRAQWEIRRLAGNMRALCNNVLPAVFARAGARCEALGHCPEGPKFTCGRYPLP